MESSDYNKENIFKIIGISDFSVESLKKTITDNLASCQVAVVKYNHKKEVDLKISASNFQEEEKKMIKSENEKGTSGEEIDKKVNEYEEKIKSLLEEARICREDRRNANDKYLEFIKKLRNENNIYNLLFSYIKIMQFYNTRVNTEETEENNQFRLACAKAEEMFKSSEDIKKYLDNMEKIKQVKKPKAITADFFIRQYVDVPNCNLYKFKYIPTKKHSDSQDYVYQVKVSENPECILNSELSSGEKIYVYDLGEFNFGKYVKSNNRPTYVSSPRNILSIIKKNKDGRISLYNGIMDVDKEDMQNHKKFYSRVVFSDFVLNNATINNFGYIGNVNEDESELNFFDRKLCFDSIETADLVTALSFASNHKGNINLENCDNLKSIYPQMNKKVLDMIITELGEYNDEQGGR